MILIISQMFLPKKLIFPWFHHMLIMSFKPSWLNELAIFALICKPYPSLTSTLCEVNDNSEVEETNTLLDCLLSGNYKNLHTWVHQSEIFISRLSLVFRVYCKIIKTTYKISIYFLLWILKVSNQLSICFFVR